MKRKIQKMLTHSYPPKRRSEFGKLLGNVVGYVIRHVPIFAMIIWSCQLNKEVLLTGKLNS